MSLNTNKFFHIICLSVVLSLFSCKRSPSLIPYPPIEPERGLVSRPSNPSCLAIPPSAETNRLILTPVFENVPLNLPVHMIQAPGDTSYWYVIDQDGKIIQFPNDPLTQDYSIYLDISEKVRGPTESGNWEFGLLGMAFHPNFPQDSRVFIYYTREPINGESCPRDTLSSFLWNDANQSLDSDSETILLSGNENCSFHHGGTILFGPDGYLYLSIGEQSFAPNAQDLTNIYGSLLRMDIDGAFPYQIPPDNPFQEDGMAKEIFAYGLRNPWRYSFDRLTGQIWLGDVGGGNWEEVNLIAAGANYGWPIFEGPVCLAGPCDTSGLTTPIASYDHNQGCAITGGHVYRGTSVPDLFGVYLFGDFCSGNIWGLIPGPYPLPQMELLQITDFNISAFAEDNVGEVFVLDRKGKIFKLTGFKESSMDQLPNLLSQTGCFDAKNPKIPLQGLIPYSVNMPLWSDGSAKDRWMALPDGTQIEILDNQKWKFPQGTVLLKNFRLGDRLIETRLLMQYGAGEWMGITYEWNEEQTEAYLVPDGGKTTLIEGQNWAFPSRSQCLRCHTQAAGRALGLETPQLNRLFTYLATGVRDNQIEALAYIGMFSNLLVQDFEPEKFPAFPSWESIIDSPPLLEETARAYLHTNCAICHQPGGGGIGPPDLRASTPISEMSVCNMPPTVSTLGIPDGKLLVPGQPEKSILLQRMSRTDEHRMPPLSSLRVDEGGIKLIADWIRATETCGE